MAALVAAYSTRKCSTVSSSHSRPVPRPSVGIEGVTGFDPHGFLEDGHGEVVVLEPVSRRGDGQKECLSPGRCGS